MLSGFSTVYRNLHPDTLAFLNFFLNVGEGPLTVASGPLSATFPTVAVLKGAWVGHGPSTFLLAPPFFFLISCLSSFGRHVQ